MTYQSLTRIEQILYKKTKFTFEMYLKEHVPIIYWIVFIELGLKYI